MIFSEFPVLEKTRGWLAVFLAGVLSSAVALAGQAASPTGAPASSTAAPSGGVESAAVAGDRLDMALGKSRMLSLKGSISRLAVGNPAVADVKILNPRQLWVLGIGVGSTNLILWDKAGDMLATFDVNVNLDVEQINDELRKLVKDGNVRVRSVHDKVILEGQVSDAATAASVVGVAEAFGHKNVINLLKVDAVPQSEPGQPPAAVEQIEIIRGTEMTTKQFKAPQQ